MDEMTLAELETVSGGEPVGAIGCLQWANTGRGGYAWFPGNDESYCVLWVV